MRFLADESCDFAIITALRGVGEDVVAVAQTVRGADDARVLEMAQRDGRVLLTEDKDFGTLVFAAGYQSGGVILLRYPIRTRSAVVAALTKLVRQRGHELPGAFTVVEPGGFASAALPHRVRPITPSTPSPRPRARR